MGMGYSHYMIPRDNTVRPSAVSIAALINAWIEKGYVIQPQTVSERDAPYSPFVPSGACFVARLPTGEILKRKRPATPPKGFWQRLMRGTEKPLPYFDERLPFPVPPIGQALSYLEAPYAVIFFQGSPHAANPLRTLTHSAAQGDSRFPHSLIIEVSDDFLHPRTDVYSEAKQINPICVCGNNLEYEDTSGFNAWLADTKIRRVCPVCGLVFRPQDHVAEIVNGVDGSKRPELGGLCNRFGIIIDFDKDFPNYLRGPDGTVIETGTEPKVRDEFFNNCTKALGLQLNEFSYFV